MCVCEPCVSVSCVSVCVRGVCVCVCVCVCFVGCGAGRGRAELFFLRLGPVTSPAGQGDVGQVVLDRWCWTGGVGQVVLGILLLPAGWLATLDR